jgi:predicted hotdog family 3-hydroxylacyl-ACP dehydratase
VTDIGELLPHRGHARLIERVLQWDVSAIVATTMTHRSADNPLRFEGKLASVHLVEYGAQTMALHGALRALANGGIPRSALLVSVRDFRTSVDSLESLGELTISARPLLATATSWQYAFEVSCAGQPVASGRVAAMAHDLPPPNS